MTGQSVRRERTLSMPVRVPDDAATGLGVNDDRMEPSLGSRVRGESRSAERAASPGERSASVSADNETRPSRGARSMIRTAIKGLLWAAAFPVLCILPVILTLHVSVSAYHENTYSGWMALGIGVMAAMLLICLYIIAFMLSFRIRTRQFVHFANIWLVAILCYGGYALFHLSNANAKTEEIRSYYTSLHPLLRVAVKNLTLFDGQLVITDLNRTRADYRAMGLPAKERSMHYEQSTGFVHAVDIRTKGRSKVKNLLVELYFVLMGFETRRHVGTADHLHISLPLRETDMLTASSDTGPT